MRLLVTGGAGFIGSNFIEFWLKRYPGDKIISLDKLTYAGHLSSTKNFSKNKNYRFVKGDIGDAATVDKLVKEVDVIVHFAAESHVDRSIKGPGVFVVTNVVGTQVLLDAALRHEIKRFHHISTDEVFGSLPLNSVEKFTLDTGYDPRSPYAASKAAADHLVRAYYQTYGLPITITNSSNNYGSFQDPEKFLPRAITNLIDGRPIPIYGDGRHIRDWLYVEDHCRAISLVLAKGKIGKTYLVGGLTKDVDNLSVAKKIICLMGRDEKKDLKFVKDRAGHDRRYAVDWSQTRRELGWKPKRDFDFYLKKTINWYVSNEWWWRPIKKKAEELYRQTGQR